MSKEHPNKRDDCPFPACTGGCHVCVLVRQQRVARPFYEAAVRVLARSGVDADTQLIAEYVEENTRPQWDEIAGKWIDRRVASGGGGA